MDDLLIACPANNENVLAIKKCLEVYCGWSGQCPNLDKSSVLFSKNICQRTRKKLRIGLGLKEMKEGLVYFGNTLVFGKHKSKDFNRLKDRIQL